MEDLATGESEVIDLLNEYMTAKEGGGQADMEDLERRAGSEVAELRRHIEVAERVSDLSRLIAVEVEGTEQESQFGRFRTTEVLGTGGYSKVYLAEDPELKRQIALKVIPLSRNGENNETLAEARALASLDHPSVVKVYEVGEVDERGGMAYIAMERIHGPDLRAVLKKLHALDTAGRTEEAVEEGSDLAVAESLQSTAARCALVARMARALSYCHGAGIVHRDVKPENILVQAGMNPTLVDFGMAREESEDLANATQGLRGTPAYFAPEQVDQGTGGASFASDQFSLGVVLYELLTLAHPFRTDTLNGTMNAISASDPVPIRRRNPAIPLDVGLICSRAMSRNPGDRYENIQALAEDLEAFIQHRAVSVRPPSLSRQLTLSAVRYRRYIAVALLACTAVVGLLLVGWVASYMRTQRAMVELIEHQAQQVATLSRPGDFESLLVAIVNQRADARALDDAVLGKVLGADLGEQLDDVWRKAITRHKLEALEPARLIRPSENQEPFAEYFRRWEGLSFLAYHFTPDVGRPGVSVLGGVVHLPSQGRLQRVSRGSIPATPTYVEVTDWSVPLPSGFYRYTDDSGEAMIETEFLLRAEDPAWSPPLNPLAPEVATQMHSMPAGVIPKKGRYPAASYAPFSITKRPVTWGEVRAAFTDEELSQIPTEQYADGAPPTDDQPAAIPHVFAHEYAVRQGARLPTAVELYVAAQAGQIELGVGLLSEWTSASFYKILNDAYPLEYSAEGSEELIKHISRLTKKANHESETAGVGFRLARTGGL